MPRVPVLKMRTLNDISVQAIQKVLTRVGLEGCPTLWRVSTQKTGIIQSDLGGSHLTRTVSKCTLQGDAIFLVIWLIVIDEIIKKLDNGRRI